MRRSYIFWGVILISFGGIFILDGINLLPGNPLEYLWQVFLIILGTWIIINSCRKTKDEKTEYFSIALQGATQAKIRINHGAGLLNINSGAKKGELLTYSSMGTIQQYTRQGLLNINSGAKKGELLTYSSIGTIQQYTRHDGDFMEARLSPGSDIIPLLGLAEGFNWNIQLNNEIPLSLILETGASQTIADFSDLNITDLKLSTGASTSTIVLPSIPNKSEVSVNAGVASLNIQVPVNVSARIRVKDDLTSLSIDKDRFTRIDANTYQSQDYSYGAHQTEIKIEAGVGSITIH